MRTTRTTVGVIAALTLVAGAAVASAGMDGGSDVPQTWSSSLGSSVAPPDTPEVRAAGAHIYERACAACHGATGKGDGPGAALLPTPPRDLSRGVFRVRSTPSGSLPMDEDLYRTISVGFAEYGMPRFAHLTPAERWSLVYYIKTLSPYFESDEPEDPLTFAQMPVATPDRLARGKEVYALLQCAQCHGETGRGDGPSAYVMTDDRGRPIYTRDLTGGPRAFKRGPTAPDILAALVTGLDGSPMPSYEGVVDDADLVAVAQYVEALSQEP